MALDRQILFQNSSGQRKKKGSVGFETKTYLVARVPGDRQGHFRLLTGHKVLPEREEDNLGLSESTVFGRHNCPDSASSAGLKTQCAGQWAHWLVEGSS